MRINGIKVIGDQFAYDGGHKIYILENELELEEALRDRYDIYPIEDIKNKYDNSGALRFIYNWNINTIYSDQGTDATFSG